MVTMVLLKVERTCAIPVWTFLLPLALMIFGFSTSFGSSERFSFGGSGAAGSSFLALAGFLAGLAGASAAAVTAAGACSVVAAGVSETGAELSAAGVSPPSVSAFALGAFFGLSAASGFAGLFSSESAMVKNFKG